MNPQIRSDDSPQSTPFLNRRGVTFDWTINPSLLFTIGLAALAGLSFAVSVSNTMERDRYLLNDTVKDVAQQRVEQGNLRTEFLQALDRHRIDQQSFNNKLEGKLDTGLQKIDAKVDSGLREVRDDIRKVNAK